MNFKELYEFLKNNSKLDFFVSNELEFKSSLVYTNGEYSDSKFDIKNKLSYSFFKDNKMRTFKNTYKSAVLNNIKKAAKLLKVGSFNSKKYVLPFHNPTSRVSYLIDIDTSFIYKFIRDFSNVVTNYKDIKSYCIYYDYRRDTVNTKFNDNRELIFTQYAYADIEVCIYFEHDLDSIIVKRTISHNGFKNLDLNSLIKDMYEESILKLKELEIKGGVYNLLLRNNTVPIFLQNLKLYNEEDVSKASNLNLNILCKDLNIFNNHPDFKARYLPSLDPFYVHNKPFCIVEDGKLKSLWFYKNSDLFKECNLNEFCSSDTFYYPAILPTDNSFKDLFNTYSDFLYVTNLYSDDYTLSKFDSDDFKCFAEGFIVRNGVIQGFTHFVISFNRYEFLSSIVKVGNDPYSDRYGASPSILVKDINVYSLYNADLYTSISQFVCRLPY